MTDDEKKMNMLIELAGAFDKELTKDVLKRKLRALYTMKVEELEFAINESIRCDTWMPSIGKLWAIVEEKREVERDELTKKVVSWLMKNTAWDYSMEANQEDVDNALGRMGYEADI